jgi:TPR repeat protein
MNKLISISIILVLQASLLFSQTPWQDFVNEQKSQADAGDADAQGTLSILIQTQATSGSNEQAYSFAEKSVTASSAFGFYALGRCYEKGLHISMDESKAKELFSKSLPALKNLAETGNAFAAYLAGASFEIGRGVGKDEDEALKWYRKAAEQGVAIAQALMGGFYLNGRAWVLNRDLNEAVKWYRKAADQGFPDAEYEMGLFYARGKDVRGDGVEKDEVEAVNWWRKAADHGLGKAQFILGLCYADGIGVLKDEVEAEKFYRKAIEQGYNEALEKLNKLPSIRKQSLEKNIIDAKKRYMEMAIDDAPVLSSGPSKEVIIDGMLPLCSVLENQYKDTSFKIQRGNTQISNGYKGIPIGVEMFPIRLSGSQIQFTYYFYQDEFNDWKIVEK